MAVATNFSSVHCYQEGTTTRKFWVVVSLSWQTTLNWWKLGLLCQGLEGPLMTSGQFGLQLTRERASRIVRKNMFAASFGCSLQVSKQESHLRKENTLRESRGNTKTWKRTSTSFSLMETSHWSMSFAMKRKTRSRKVFLKPYSP